MSIRLVNISGSEQELLKTWAIDAEVEITEENRHHYSCAEVFTAIDNEDFVIKCGEETLGIETSKAVLDDKFLSSFAVDKGPDAGTDQNLSGNDWAVITATQALWDITDDYDTDTDDFVVPYDGIYFHDGQWMITDITNCTAIEIACFKREEEEDDYWFILDKKPIGAGQTEAQMSAGTTFDFYEGERYCIKIKLYGENASAKISGADDYTAWGYCFSRSIYG